MKKTWVKRENMYHKPFYKQKTKMLLLFVFLLGILFFVYQAFTVNQLQNSSTPWSLESTMQGLREKHKQMVQSLGRKETDADIVAGGGGNGGIGVVGLRSSSQYTNSADDAIKIIRGIRLFDYDSYKPNFEGKFKCLDGSQSIAFDRVNDDFCDCISDGSDEPSTNACAMGRYYCKYQKRHITGRGRDVSVSSSRINDGICDCCDGSDEWTTTKCHTKCT